MEGVSTLEKVTWPFQLLGLQNFSLKNVEKTSKSKVFLEKFSFLTLFWIGWASIFALFLVDDFKKPSEFKNYLYIIFKFLNFVNYSSAVFIAVIFSVVKHSKLVSFFQKSNQVTNYCLHEFNHSLKFHRFKSHFAIFYVFKIIYFSLVTLYIPFPKNSGIVDEFVKPIFWIIETICLDAFTFRFYFYVRIVNFHLENLSELVRGKFGKVRSDSFKISATNSNEKRRIAILRKIYLLLREMADCINDSMGLIFSIQLFMLIVNIVRFGYEFFINIDGATSTFESIFCEFCLIEAIKWS